MHDEAHDEYGKRVACVRQKSGGGRLYSDTTICSMQRALVSRKIRTFATRSCFLIRGSNFSILLDQANH